MQGAVRSRRTTARGSLETSNRELDQFAYVASHDLKAPVNLSQWIEEDLGAQNFSAETREHFTLIRGRVHRMEALINGILQYSRQVEAYNLHVAGYLLKPVTFASFCETMASLNKYWALVEWP